MYDHLSPQEKELWLDAKTIAEYGKLMERWFKNEISLRPSYLNNDELNTTSAAMTEALSNLSSNGLMIHSWYTDLRPDNAKEMNRAYANAYVTKATYEKLESALRNSELLFLPGMRMSSTFGLAVGLDNQGEIIKAVTGGLTTGGNVAESYNESHPDFLEEILNGVNIAIVDLEWGRTDRFLEFCKKFSN